ncbi:MAG: GNAT family N-acetyltransferase [Verrucomicrobiota bacterium]
MTLRPATAADHDAIWSIFHAVIASGDTYVFDPAMSREAALAYWFHEGTRPWVAEAGGIIAGTFILKANNPGLGSHVANAAFMVSPAARGLGTGKLMASHCLDEARRLGFRAMQFNFVVSTNTTAVRLWQQLGFRIIGTLPGAYRHSRLGYVDAHVMFRSLLED